MYDDQDLPDTHFSLFGDYIAEMRIGNPEAVAEAILLNATPTPRPTPIPVPTPVQAAPSTNEPTAAPTNSEMFEAAKEIYDNTAADVGCAYCHGLDGAGVGTGEGETAPDIRGLGRSEIREAIRGTPDMVDIKLTNEELVAMVQYLAYLNEQR